MLLRYLICRWDQVSTKVIQIYNIAVRQYCKLPCPAKASIINVLIHVGRAMCTKNLTTSRGKKASTFTDIEEMYLTPD